jgi:hypothetical protein
VWLAGVIVVLAAGLLAYLVSDDGGGDWAADATRAAQTSGLPGDEALVAGDADTGSGGTDTGTSRAESAGTPAAVYQERPRWVSTRERVRRHEALPCTGPREPINFDVFSAGPAVAGVPVTGASRRCDAGALADEVTSNYFAYVYGDCQPQPEAGCLPPLQIRSYPACQRTYADYSFDGEPLPYTELPPIDGAKVYEIEFLVDHRIEIYTGTSTIAISAADWSLAEEALDQLRGQTSGEPPATSAASLANESQNRLQPPAKEAIEGDLPCHV